MDTAQLRRDLNSCDAVFAVTVTADRVAQSLKRQSGSPADLPISRVSAAPWEALGGGGGGKLRKYYFTNFNLASVETVVQCV